MFESDRAKLVRDQIVVEAKSEPKWLANAILKMKQLGDDDGPVGMQVFVPFGDRDLVEQLSKPLQQSASLALGVPVKWVHVENSRPTHFPDQA